MARAVSETRRTAAAATSAPDLRLRAAPTDTQTIPAAPGASATSVVSAAATTAAASSGAAATATRNQHPVGQRTAGRSHVGCTTPAATATAAREAA